MIALFVAGYVLIALEHKIKINKAAVALLMCGAIWSLFSMAGHDAGIASEYAWRFLQDARKHDLPAIGELEALRQIHERRRTMKNGYGLLRKQA